MRVCIRLILGIHVLEVAIRDDFRSTEAAKQLVNLFVRHNTHQEKESYALSWNSLYEASIP